MSLVIYRFVSFLNLAALGFGIYGAYKVSQDSLSTGQNVANPFADTALIAFAVVFALSVLFFLYLWAQIRTIGTRERRTLFAVLIAIPLFAVRIIYALIGDFARNKSFNPYNGDETIYLCMDVLEEIAIVYIFLATGFSLPPLSKSDNVPRDLENSSNSPSNEDTRKHHRSPQSSSAPLHEKRQSHTAHNKKQPRTSEHPPQRAKTAAGPITWIYYTAQDSLERRRN